MTPRRLHPNHPIVDRLVSADEDAAALRAAFGCFPSGVAAVSAVVDGEPAVLVASSFQVGISLDPPLVLFAVQRSSTSWPLIRHANRIGVSILADEHSQAARSLSRGTDRFATVDAVTTPTGAHLVRGASAWMETSIHAEVPAGDHDVILLRVHGLATLEGSEPLVWHGSGFRSLSVRQSS